MEEDLKSSQTLIGVGIDTARYGHYVTFLREDLQPAAKPLEMAEKAVQIDSANGAYLDTIGWIHYKLGNYELARDYILHALSLRENSAEVIEHMGNYMR